jgi:hypothetical protein
MPAILWNFSCSAQEFLPQAIMDVQAKKTQTQIAVNVSAV